MAAYQDLLPCMDAFPKNMKKAKDAKQMTNAELTELSGVSASAVNKLLAGSQVEPKLFNCVALCKVLGVSLDRLFGLSVPMDTPDALKTKVHTLEVCEAFKTGEIKRLQETVLLQDRLLRSRKNTAVMLLCFCTLLTIALAGYIIMDASQVDAGLIRLAEPTVAVWALLGLVCASAVVIVWCIAKYARSK